MPIRPLLKADIQLFKESLNDSNKSTDEHFNDLKALYARFNVNEQQLYSFEFSLNLQRIQSEYLNKKQHYNNQLADLKQQFKQIDNRIIAAEQKLIRGIPDDLDLMDKLIAEQESIVNEQEKLNTAELELVELVTSIDISHGKALEKLQQSKQTQALPLDIQLENTVKEINAEQEKLKFKSKLIYLFPLVFIPTILELLASRLGLSTLNAKGGSHSIFGHYIFLLALIAVQFFLSDKIIKLIGKFLSQKYLNNSVSALENRLRVNQENIKLLEKQTGVSMEQFLNKNN